MEVNNKEIKRRSTFSLLFYINHTKVRKDGACKLLYKVSTDTKLAPININASVDPSLWNPETRRANGRSENARAVNLATEKLTEKIIGYYRHIRRSLGFVTVELIKDAVEGIGQKPFTLLALSCEHSEESCKCAGVNRREETYESYENSYSILASSMKKRREKEGVALRGLDREFYDDFEISLCTDREMKSKTVHGHLCRLKRMTKRVASQDTLRRDPYEKLYPELSWRRNRHLKLEDLRKLMEIPANKPSLQRAWDWFLFAIFTGLSYADLKRLSEKDIMQSGDGTYWTHIRRQKTETSLAIRLLNVPLQIVEKYRHERESDRIFNLYCRGYLIKLTRELGRTYGFDMTFHRTRHNFGTHITPPLGVSIETVSRMMGHKSISTTQIYAKMTDRKVDEDMEQLEGQIKGRKMNLYEEDEPEAADIITVSG